MENLIKLPVGAVDQIRVLEDTKAYYSYLTYDVFNEVHKGEEHFVYKKIDGWYLIGNHQWVDSKYVESLLDKEPTIETVEVEIIEDIVAIEKPFEIIDAEIIEEKVEEKPTLFGKIKKMFNK